MKRIKVLNIWMNKKENLLHSRLFSLLLPLLFSGLLALILSLTLFDTWVLQDTNLHFFNHNFFLALFFIYILLLSAIYLYKYIFYHRSFRIYRTKKLFKNLCMLLIFLVLFWGVLLCALLLDKIKITLPGNNNLNGFIYFFIVNVILSLGIISLIDFLEKKHPLLLKILKTVTFYIVPVLTFIMVEVLLDSDVNIYFIYILGNLFIYYVLFFILSAVINCKKIVLLIYTTCYFIFAAANYFVHDFRGHPIIVADIWSLRTALSVSNNYIYNLSFEFLFGLTFYLTIIIMIGLFYKIEPQQLKLKQYLINFVKCLIFAAVCLVLLQNDSFDITVNKWSPIYSYKTKGTALCVFNEFLDANIQEPEGYSVEKVKDISDKIKLTQANKKDSTYVKPNIIVIMNESFSDLSVVRDFQTDRDYMPFIRSLRENTIKGNLLVSVHGGNTCNTEYEFLTGNSFAFLPHGSVAYQQFVKTKMSSICTVMNSQNYTVTGIHPYNIYGWSRYRVYPLLGIDTFYSQDDFINPILWRGYISDESSYHKIKEISKQNNNESNFIFNVTMQNHGGYSRLLTLDNWIRIKNEDTFYPDIEQYLTSVYSSDQAYKNLINYYKECKEPTIILFFGDHQPGFSETAKDFLYGDIENASLDRQQKKYTVPFLIWANYDIEEKENEYLSANYLSSYLLDIANVKMSPFQEYLLELRKKIPAINAFGYLGDDGKWYEFDKETTYTNYIKEYQYIQYNNMFDKKNRINEFFE